MSFPSNNKISGTASTTQPPSLQRPIPVSMAGSRPPTVMLPTNQTPNLFDQQLQQQQNAPSSPKHRPAPLSVEGQPNTHSVPGSPLISPRLQQQQQQQMFSSSSSSSLQQQQQQLQQPPPPLPPLIYASTSSSYAPQQQPASYNRPLTATLPSPLSPISVASVGGYSNGGGGFARPTAGLAIDKETLNRQFDHFEASHQAIRDFFLKQDQLLGEERRRFEEWKIAQQQWLDQQRRELSAHQNETKQHEDHLQNMERDIQRRERDVQRLQQNFQNTQRALALAQQAHQQIMQQNSATFKQQQDQIMAAEQQQIMQQQQMTQQEQQQQMREHQLETQRMQQAAMREQLSHQQLALQQQTQTLQQQAAQQRQQLLREPAPLLFGSSLNTTATAAAATAASGFHLPIYNTAPGISGLPSTLPLVSTLIPPTSAFVPPQQLHAYFQDREESLSTAIRTQVPNGAKWIDPDFRPDNSSLFCSSSSSSTPWTQQSNNCKWIRATEFFHEAALFKGDDGGPSGANLQQGVLGDLWLLNALACVATHPNVIRNLVVAQYPAIGLFEFRFWKGGKWINVVVDDHLPVRSVAATAFQPQHQHSFRHSSSSSSSSEQQQQFTLLGSSCTDHSELWVPLIEKAYAKLHGSYQALNGGNTEYAMADLTGGVTEHINVVNSENGHAVLSTPQGLLTKIQQAKGEGWLSGCIFKPNVTVSTNTVQSNGLIPNHLYPILDVRETTTNNSSHGGITTTLVRLRNPWGVGGWNGSWGINSPMWTQGMMNQFSYQQYSNNDSQAQQPTFWMDIRDIEENIYVLPVCRVYNHNIGDPWYMAADLGGCWAGANAGGQVSLSNPQYICSSQEDAAGFAFLCQHDIPFKVQDRCNDANPAYRKPNFPDPNPNLCCGTFVLRCDTHSRSNNPTGNVLTKDIVKYAMFVYGRQTGTEFRFEAGKSLCIMPCQFQAKLEAPFQLYVFSSKPFLMRKTLGEGFEQTMPSFSIAYSTPPQGFTWDRTNRNKCIVERQQKGEVLEEDDER